MAPIGGAGFFSGAHLDFDYLFRVHDGVERNHRKSFGPRLFLGASASGISCEIWPMSRRGEGDFAVLQGGSPVAEFFRLTAEQMRDRVLASGALSEERLDQAIALLKDPDFWAFTDGMIAVWGQRPTKPRL